MLRCSPQELLGEWTPEKWDYWLQTAREAEILAQDELALARQGMMTLMRWQGNIYNKCR
ncbi:DNA polymerase III subunits gamma and tau [Psychrobacter sp. JCM 18902]|nr:DNA polymerase III subunits gamma and tau [Psychrobacter sp. JCM 18902]